MSLGPSGASLDPEQVENFEDVRLDRLSTETYANEHRWKSSLPSKVRLFVQLALLFDIGFAIDLAE